MFGSRLSRLSDVVNAPSFLRDYFSATVSITGLLALLGVAAGPLLPLLGVVAGDYVSAIPYGMALFGAAVLPSLASLYSTYFWVLGNGRLSVVGVAVGTITSVVFSALFLWAGLGLVGAIAALYLGQLASLFFFAYFQNVGGRVASLSAFFLILSVSAVASYFLQPGLWPFPQLAALATGLAAAYILKPLPPSAVSQLPRWLQPFLAPFST